MIAWLEKAAGFGLPNYTVFRDDPHFAALHGRPQYKQLLQGSSVSGKDAKDFGNPTLLAARMAP